MRLKAFVRFGLVALLATSSVACDMLDIPKKMDETNEGIDSLEGKMDDTTGGIGEVSGKLDDTGEGLDEVSGKLDETNGGLGDVNSKLDETNGGLGSVNSQLEETNASLGGVGASLDETNAGLDRMGGQLAETNEGIRSTNNGVLATLDEIRQTNTSIDQLNERMAVTNAAIHSQVLLLAKDDLMRPENTVMLFPPVGMMPDGKKFAEEVFPLEALELTHTWLVDIDTPDVDVATIEAQGYSAEEAARLQARMSHKKDAELVGLQIINGFLPQATVEQVAQHVLDNGRYKQAALSALMLRAVFLDVYLLQGSFFKDRLTDYGQMLEAAEAVAQIDYLGRLPFADRIGYNTLRTDEVRFDPKEMLPRLYAELDRRFDSDLDPVYQDSASTDATVREQGEQLRQLRAEVKEALAYWAGVAR